MTNEGAFVDYVRILLKLWVRSNDKLSDVNKNDAGEWEDVSGNLSFSFGDYRSISSTTQPTHRSTMKLNSAKWPNLTHNFGPRPTFTRRRKMSSSMRL